MKKIVVIGVVIAFIFLVIAFLISKYNPTTPIEPVKTPPQPTQKQDTAEIAPEESVLVVEKDNDYVLIQQEFSKKYDKPVDNVNLTINKIVGNFARGSITFKGARGGAGWLAAKQDGSWILVFDGNGIIPCADVAPYDFPAEFTPGC